jgi:hypothetical protein
LNREVEDSQRWFTNDLSVAHHVNEGEEGGGIWIVEDAEWWFNLWIVRRNEKKEEECGCRVVVQLVDCKKE